MDNVGIQYSDIVHNLQHSYEFFVSFFLGDEIDSEASEYQIDLWEKRLTDEKLTHQLLCVPRDHIKTTLAKLSVIYKFMFTHRRFAFYLTNASRNAKNAAVDIIRLFQKPNYQNTFGEIRMVKDNESEGLWIFEIPLPNGNVKQCIIRAAGARQPIRGQNVLNTRPDYVVVDDLEDLENTATEELRDKLSRWVFGTLLKSFNTRDYRILWIGNMISNESLLYKFSSLPKWNPVVLGALIKDKKTNKIRPLWPEQFTVENLVRDFHEYRSAGRADSWMCEMMNKPGFMKNGFSISSIKYAPDLTPDDYAKTFITIDPAFTEEPGVNDQSAIAVHGLRQDGRLQLADTWLGRVTEQDLFIQADILAQKWGVTIWGIEAQVAQKLLLPLFRLYSAMSKTTYKYTFLPLHSRQIPKFQRLQSLVNSMQNEHYFISNSDVDFTSQLISYDPLKTNNRDDLIDATAYGPFMFSLYEYEIRNSATLNDPSQIPQIQTGDIDYV